MEYRTNVPALVGGNITNESTFRDLITSEGTSLQMRVPLHECGTPFTPAALGGPDKVDEPSFDMFGQSLSRRPSAYQLIAG